MNTQEKELPARRRKGSKTVISKIENTNPVPSTKKTLVGYRQTIRTLTDIIESRLPTGVSALSLKIALMAMVQRLEKGLTPSLEETTKDKTDVS